MTILGYETHTAIYSPEEQDDILIPIIGFSAWTFNSPVRERLDMKVHGFLLKKRKIIATEKGLYLHLWLFSYRFDLDFRKRIPNEN